MRRPRCASLEASLADRLNRRFESDTSAVIKLTGFIICTRHYDPRTPLTITEDRNLKGKKINLDKA